jgi:hypothetical protein
MPFAEHFAGSSAVTSRTRHSDYFSSIKAPPPATTLIECVSMSDWHAWVAAQGPPEKRWLSRRRAIKPAPGDDILIPAFAGTDVGNARPRIVGLAPGAGLIWAAAVVYGSLPEGRVYSLV